MIAYAIRLPSLPGLEIQDLGNHLAIMRADWGR
jgi:hypothetical protein